MNFEERLDRLEMELTHQQRTTDQLNDVVTEQSMELLRLQRALAQAAKQIQEMRAKAEKSEPVDLVDEKPPHY
jgi:uncharacterized coiled-coil protein SlyX